MRKTIIRFIIYSFSAFSSHQFTAYKYYADKRTLISIQGKLGRHVPLAFFTFEFHRLIDFISTGYIITNINYKCSSRVTFLQNFDGTIILKKRRKYLDYLQFHLPLQNHSGEVDFYSFLVTFYNLSNQEVYKLIN